MVFPGGGDIRGKESPAFDLDESGHFLCYKLFKNFNNASYCSGVSLSEIVNNVAWRSFNKIAWELSSKKNCDTDIPKASHIFIREGIVGNIPLRYHEEIVDCVSPDFSAS